MRQYNAENNAAHNKDMGRRQTEKRFEQLEGDAWTTQEIYAQGFSRKTKTRRDFMKSEFDEYRMHPYKVKFLTDDVFRLGGNQRSKLQYHILAQRFPLVHVSE